MHWEIDIPPASATSGVDWSTVDGAEEDDMDYRKILDRIGAPKLEELRLAGRWAGETAYYFDGRSDSEPGANQNLVEVLIASDQVASLDTDVPAPPKPHDHKVPGTTTSTSS